LLFGYVLYFAVYEEVVTGEPDREIIGQTPGNAGRIVATVIDKDARHKAIISET
jgi:hypothetical protein